MRHVEYVNPRNDVDFAMLVDRLAASAEGPEELEQALRATYPNAVVRVRGLDGDRIAIWYVYRDGSWSPMRPKP